MVNVVDVVVVVVVAAVDAAVDVVVHCCCEGAMKKYRSLFQISQKNASENRLCAFTSIENKNLIQIFILIIFHAKLFFAILS